MIIPVQIFVLFQANFISIRFCQSRQFFLFQMIKALYVVV